MPCRRNDSSLPLAIAAAIAVALPAAAASAARRGGDGRVELEVAAVLPMPEGPGRPRSCCATARAGTRAPAARPGRRGARRRRTGATRAPAGLLGRAIEALGGARPGGGDRRGRGDLGGRARPARPGRARSRACPRARRSRVALAVAAGAPIFTTRSCSRRRGSRPRSSTQAHAGSCPEAGARAASCRRRRTRPRATRSSTGAASRRAPRARSRRSTRAARSGSARASSPCGRAARGTAGDVERAALRRPPSCSRFTSARIGLRASRGW